MFSSLSCVLLQDVFESLSHSPEDQSEIKEALQTDRLTSSPFVLSRMGTIGACFKVMHLIVYQKRIY